MSKQPNDMCKFYMQFTLFVLEFIPSKQKTKTLFWCSVQQPY